MIASFPLPCGVVDLSASQVLAVTYTCLVVSMVAEAENTRGRKKERIGLERYSECPFHTLVALSVSITYRQSLVGSRTSCAARLAPGEYGTHVFFLSLFLCRSLFLSLCSSQLIGVLEQGYTLDRLKYVVPATNSTSILPLSHSPLLTSLATPNSSSNSTTPSSAFAVSFQLRPIQMYTGRTGTLQERERGGGSGLGRTHAFSRHSHCLHASLPFPGISNCGRSSIGQIRIK